MMAQTVQWCTTIEYNTLNADIGGEIQLRIPLRGRASALLPEETLQPLPCGEGPPSRISGQASAEHVSAVVVGGVADRLALWL